MQIKLTDGAEATILPSRRPPPVNSLAAEAREDMATVVLSEQTRSLHSTLTRSTTDLADVELRELLTQEDRILLAWVAEQARAEGGDLSEVRKLAIGLARYRAQQQGLEGSSATPVVHDEPILSLARLTSHEEVQARAILFGLATTRSTLDPGFVHALLDPTLRDVESVSLSFLQRVVAALPPGTSERLAGLEATLAQRDAREALVAAFDRLALSRRELGAATPERLSLGAVLLRERAALVFPQSRLRLPTGTTAQERGLLGLLYVVQTERAGDLALVDDVARALVIMRSVTTHSVQTSQPKLPPQAAEGHALGSAMQLAAKATVAYRSVAPPRPSTLPPPATSGSSAPPVFGPSVDAGQPSIAAFSLAQSLGLSALVADIQAQAMRVRRRLGRRERDRARRVSARGTETSSYAPHDPARHARRLALWRRWLQHRRSRP